MLRTGISLESKGFPLRVEEFPYRVEAFPYRLGNVPYGGGFFPSRVGFSLTQKACFLIGLMFFHYETRHSLTEHRHYNR